METTHVTTQDSTVIRQMVLSQQVSGSCWQINPIKKREIYFRIIKDVAIFESP